MKEQNKPVEDKPDIVETYLKRVKDGLDAHNSDLGEQHRCSMCPYYDSDNESTCVKNLLLDAEAHIWVLETRLAVAKAQTKHLEIMLKIAKGEL